MNDIDEGNRMNPDEANEIWKWMTRRKQELLDEQKAANADEHAAEARADGKPDTEGFYRPDFECSIAELARMRRQRAARRNTRG